MEELSNSQRRLNSERKKQADDRRDAILQAAFRLFLEKGIMGVTMNDICKRTSLSRATLYRYYESMEHIAYELAGKIFSAQMGRAVSDLKDGVTVNTARSIIFHLIDNFESERDELAYMAMFEHYYPLVSTDMRYEEAYLKRLKDFFHLEITSGALTNGQLPVLIQKISVVITMARGYLEHLSRPGIRPDRENYMKVSDQIEFLREIVERELSVIERDIDFTVF